MGSVVRVFCVVVVIMVISVVLRVRDMVCINVVFFFCVCLE